MVSVNKIECIKLYIPPIVREIVRAVRSGKVIETNAVMFGAYPSVRVLVYDNRKSRAYTQYDSAGNTIYINLDEVPDMLNILGIVDDSIVFYYVFLHEVTHAMQKERGEELSPYSVKSQYDKYYNHPSEIEAREASDRWLKKVMSKCR